MSDWGHHAAAATAATDSLIDPLHQAMENATAAAAVANSYGGMGVGIGGGVSPTPEYKFDTNVLGGTTHGATHSSPGRKVVESQINSAH